MKLWSNFYDFCNADVPGVYTFAAERELRRAAQEFFEKTKVWKADLAPVYLFPRVTEYDLEVPEGATIVKVASARNELGYEVDMLGTASGCGSIIFTTQTTFRATPTPSARSIITLNAVLMPSHDAIGIDDGLFEQYAEVIGRGAKARLYLQPQKSYTNPELGAIEQAEFMLAIAREKIAAAKGFSGAPLRTRPQFF